MKVFAKDLHSSLERGMEVSLRRTPAGDKDADEIPSRGTERFVFDVSPVKKRGLYGYEAEERLFLKISAFNPTFIGRLAAMCASGLLPNVNGELQPYESHIPMVLQVLVDLNLVGMGYLNLSACKFRLPLPEGAGNPQLLASSHPNTRMYIRGLEDIKPEMTWGFSVTKWSTSELELDAFLDDVLNRDSRPSIDADTGGDPSERAVQTLKLLWDEESARIQATVPKPVEAARGIRPGPHLSDEAYGARLRKLIAAEVSSRNIALEGSESTKDEEGAQGGTKPVQTRNRVEVRLTQKEGQEDSEKESRRKVCLTPAESRWTGFGRDGNGDCSRAAADGRSKYRT